VPAAAASSPVIRMLGLRGFLIALAVAALFVYMDIVHMSGKDFLAGADSQGTLDAPGPSDRLLLLLWTLEWVINGYTWVLLGGFASLTIRTLERHDFAHPLERVLHERHYRLSSS
jgi:hypothetical protein